MKKLVILIGVFLTIVAAGLFFIQTKVGDIRPALLPASNPFSPTPSTSAAVNGDVVDFLTIPSPFTITYFAKDVAGARDLQVSPGGTILLSQTGSGLVVALPDKDNDGISDETKVVLSGLTKPHGLAFWQGKLFVAEENKVSRYAFNEETLTATFEKKLLDLPGSGGHSSRGLVFMPDGKLLITIGSSCNVCVEEDERRAAIMITDREGTSPRIFAKGTRNSPFMMLRPDTSEVWATEMGRDLLGDNIPPEEINILENGKDYGWPYCYGNKVHDDKFDAKNEHSCGATIAPVYEFQAHSAPLGLTFIKSSLFSEDQQGDLLVSYHGSWNRSVPTGYKIVRMNIEGKQITGDEDFITGFIHGSSAQGRPVDLEFDTAGRLYISDDKAGAVYVVGKN